MLYRIMNKAKHLIIITLNSGKAIYLAPGEASRPIPDQELTGNQKVEKLLRVNVITTEMAQEPTAGAPLEATVGVESLEPERSEKKNL